MKRNTLLVTLLVSTFFVPVATAQELVQAPVYRVGDSWKYVYPNRSNETREITITEVSDAGVALLDGGQPARYDKDGNKVRDGTARWLQFPMQVGNKWSFNFNLGNAVFAIDVKVVNFTSVSTKAGKFDAFQLESCWTQRGGSFYECGLKVWYAPAVKRLVKYEAPNSWRNGRFANANYELVSYKLAEPTR